MAEGNVPNYEQLDVNGDDPATRHHKTVCLKLSLLVVSILSVVFFLALVISENKSGPSDTSGGEIGPGYGVCLTPECVNVASDIIRSLDQSADPCQDFWQYSCGGWIKTHEIPDDKVSYNTFSVLAEQNDNVIKKALTSSTTDQAVSIGHASTLYKLCMDTDAIDQRGVDPLQSELQALDWKTTGSTVTKVVAEMHKGGLAPLFNPYIGQDDKNSSRNVLFLTQSGLSLPEKSYYEKDPNTDNVLQAFRTLITTCFTLIGRQDAQVAADAVIKFETSLANITVSRADLRDPEKTYNVRTLPELTEQFPYFGWNDWLSILYPDATQKDAIQEVVVSVPTHLSSLSTLLTATEDSVLLNYLQWQKVYHAITYLGKDFKEAYFLYKKALYGVEKESDRWKHCLARVEGTYGFAVGKLFLNAKFGPESRKIAKSLIGDIKSSFKSKLPDLSWMDEATRVKAADKADRVIEKIGYPDWVENNTKLDEYYAKLVPPTDKYYETMMNARLWSEQKNLDDLFKMPNKKKWEMNPQTVNAYYSPSNNEIVFPAGILQPPFFQASFPYSLNFGAIGVVMGHELTHGFDDQGARYDADGNLKTWWSKSVQDNFKKQTTCVENQYSNYTVLGPNEETYHVNGKLTLGENIADNGGIAEAFAAYQAYIKTNGKENKIPGLNLTPDQLFFVGFAQVWCGAKRPRGAKAGVLTDPHSPHQWRVKGTVSNSKDFARVYKCPLGSPMNPVDKCLVW